MVMTLTHILPSLRASIPDPLGRDRWPEFTTASPSDVTVAGVSLTRLAEWCGTPCVHTAAAVIPGTNGRPSPTDTASVVVTQICEISEAADQSLDIWIDARLIDAEPCLNELRMIGRISTANEVRARLHTAGEHTNPAPVERIVSDVRVGDLVAIPCSGQIHLKDVDPRRHHLVDCDRDLTSEKETWSLALCRR